MKAFFLIVAFITGSIVGSFFNVVIHRLPKNESILKPRSHCPNCNTTLKWLDLIPILSFLLLKGKCRYCSKPISVKYPLVELVTALTFTFVFLKFGFSLSALKFLVFLSLLIPVGFIDLFEGVVPDHITFPGIALGFLFSLATGWQSLLNSLIGAAFMAAAFLLIILASRGGMGQGDVTLGAMIGAFLGWQFSIAAFVIAFVVGAVFGILAMIFFKKKGKDAIPFGPYLVIASYAMVFFGYKILEFYFNLFLIK